MSLQEREEGARARLLRGVPLEERRLDIAGVSMTLLEGGKGSKTIVLLHGGIECGGAVWSPVLAPLAERHRLVVPDLPGLGESAPFATLDVRSSVAWLQDLFEKTCSTETVLVAHSLCGSIAAHFAMTRPERLRHLVVYASPAVGAFRMPLSLLLTVLAFAVRPSERNMERIERRAFFDLDAMKRDRRPWLDAFTAYVRERASVPHVKRTMKALVSIGTKQIPEAELRNVRVPVSLIWGTRDRFVPFALATQAHATFGWPVHRVDDAGHVLHVERPDAFVRAVEETARGSVSSLS